MISYENEYPDAYRYIDVKDKIVLDIGVDIGTSAKWFINQGAKKDGNTKLVKRITFVLNTEKGRRK